MHVLGTIASRRGYPSQIRSTNGPEPISQKLAQWANRHATRQAFIQPCKPAKNADNIERFNCIYREEVPDMSLFDNLAEVRWVTEKWLEEYYTIQPPEALNGMKPYMHAVLIPLETFPLLSEPKNGIFSAAMQGDWPRVCFGELMALFHPRSLLVGRFVLYDWHL